MAKHLTSSEKKLTHSMAEMQCSDPNCVTIPNMCSNEIIQLEDKKSFRCFSVALCRPHDLPPDRWEMVKLPTKMPKLKKLKKGSKLDSEHILVDHITFGLFNKNRLQGVFDESGAIKAMKMFPPDETVDSSDYWEAAAKELDKARDATQNLIE